MSIRSAFPHIVREIENTWIPLSDGTRLAARIWLPVDADDTPVPAILEYLPYRKDDANASQDSTRHPYFAGFGYAGVRVDLRGTGDSDGIICDEYLAQEQDDAVEVIAWLAAQPWCSGAVGMIGYSWGGFNGLQIAARRPPALKAVVTMYSTDDRYRDDCHYVGGCLLGSDMLKWASWMRMYNALPPDPRHRDDWRDVWLDRLARTPAFIEPWVSHQVRDDYWRQGSVCEDYAAIEAATLVVGGWTDAYTNAVPRLLEHLTCERRGIIGPWAHVAPYRGKPGPLIGFLQECLRWFDRWLKDMDTGVERDPLLRVWMQESLPPSDTYQERPGRWVAENAWPPAGATARSWVFGEESRLTEAAPDAGAAGVGVAISTPQHVGRTAGVWCANGRDHELASDQRPDDEYSLVFETTRFDSEIEVLGFPIVHLELACDRPVALVAARLSEIGPDGAVTLLTWGQLNLTHRDSDEFPAPLVPGERFSVRLQLNAIGQRVAAGQRLRLALSTTHWPHAWPAPEAATVTAFVAGPSALELPILEHPGPTLAAPFEAPEQAADAWLHERDERERRRVDDPVTGVHRVEDREVAEELMPATETRFATEVDDVLEIAESDPLSARVVTRRVATLERDGWSIRVECDAQMRSTADEFVIDDEIKAFENGELVLESGEQFRIPRRLV
ncbi:MAG: CocE/NonD family hydrolase [Coriobacteriia bacterium]|nr:CocE/NonD family hydrolase [Coriobacteriia bacterium]